MVKTVQQSTATTGEKRTFLDAEITGLDENLATIIGAGSVGVKSFFDDRELELPSLNLVTPRQNVVTLVDASGMHPEFDELHKNILKKFPPDKLLEKILSTTVRIVDIPGANGLHHLHRADRIPGTVYYPVVKSSVTPRPQIARIPSENDSHRLVYLTSVRRAEDENRLRKVIK